MLSVCGLLLLACVSADDVSEESSRALPPDHPPNVRMLQTGEGREVEDPVPAGKIVVPADADVGEFDVERAERLRERASALQGGVPAGLVPLLGAYYRHYGLDEVSPRRQVDVIYVDGIPVVYHVFYSREASPSGDRLGAESGVPGKDYPHGVGGDAGNSGEQTGDRADSAANAPDHDAGYGAHTESVAMHSEPRSALFVHGYMDHVGLNKHVLGELVSQGYDVVAVDLPGHGLSGGEPARIEDFADYGEAVARVIGALPEPVPAPTVAVAHSMGAAVVLEYLERSEPAGSFEGGQRAPTLEQLIFAAPLVRIYLWPAASVAIRAGAAFLDRVPRSVSSGSSDPGYVEFVKERDPLGVDYASLRWAEAYLEWEDRSRELGTYDMPLLLLQAEDDTVVDVDYNTEFLRDRFPDTRVRTFEAARHQLFNEPLEIRKAVFAAMREFLSIP